MGGSVSRKHNMESISLRDLIQREAETGDIVLFEGTSIFGIFEECVTFTPYSHVAMLVRDPKTRKVYVWESSNADNQVDAISGKRKDGPRLVDAAVKIGYYIDHYGTGVVYRKLIKPRGSKVFSPAQWDWMRAFMRRESPKHFEQKYWTMAVSYTHRMMVNRPLDLSSVFCSEEVANTWNQAGVPLNRDADLYSPQDFSEQDEDLFTQGAVA